MGLRPAFRVEANGSEITEQIRRRLVSLSVTDQAGYRSDELTLGLSDHLPDEPLILPATGAELDVWLGYDERLVRVGTYTVDTIQIQITAGSPDLVTVRAKAAPMVPESRAGRRSIQTQRSRSFDDVTLGALVATIAEEHGLRAAVQRELAELEIGHVDQVNESDANLITRLARDLDSVAKFGGGAIVVARLGETTTASGQEIPTVTLTPAEGSSCSVELSRQWPAGSVTATYRDRSSGADVDVTVGQGEPARRVRRRYHDEASARAAAESERRASTRGERTARIQMPGDPTIQAGGRVILRGWRDGVDGVWSVTEVRHQLSRAGMVSDLTLEGVDPEQAQAQGLPRAANAEPESDEPGSWALMARVPTRQRIEQARQTVSERWPDFAPRPPGLDR